MQQQHNKVRTDGLLCLQVVHYASDGWLLHKSSEDARKQMEQEKAEAEAAARFQAEMDRALKEKVVTV